MINFGYLAGFGYVTAIFFFHSTRVLLITSSQWASLQETYLCTPIVRSDVQKLYFIFKLMWTKIVRVWDKQGQISKCPDVFYVITSFCNLFSTLSILTRAWPGSQPNAIDRGGGGGRITPPRLTPKPMTAARRARRRWKGLGETVLKHS